MLEPSDSPPDLPEPRLGLFETVPPMQLVLLGISLVFLQQFLLALVYPVLENVYLWSLLLAGLVFLGIPYRLIRRTDVSWTETLRLFPLTPTQAAWITLATLALVVPVNTLGEWNIRLIPPPEDMADTLEALRPKHGLDWLMATLSLALLVPFGEEVVFRGLMHQATRAHIGGLWSAVLTGLLFAVLHFQPWHVLGLAAMGFAMGLVFELTGTLWSAVLVHVLYNAVVLAAFLLPEDSSVEAWGATGPGVALAAGCALLAAFAFQRLHRAPSARPFEDHLDEEITSPRE